MAIKLKKSDLQTKYKYIWTRDKGDGEYAGKLDGDKVDKDEGYEVLYFLETLAKEHKINTISDINLLEDILQSDDLSDVVMRDELESEVIVTYLSMKAEEI